MRFDIITIFPEFFDFYLSQSLLKKAINKGVIKVKAHNLRGFTSDKHKVVDDKPFGGGRGMVLKVGPLYRAVSTLKARKPKSEARSKSKSSKSQRPGQKTKIILLTPRGKSFNQKMATKWSKLDQLILISGRYEGVDERVAKYIVDEKISLGSFVSMSGDLPALIVVETVARLIPGVVGKSDQLIGERTTRQGGFIEYPQYTRPEEFAVPAEAREAKAGKPKAKVWRVPKVLLSGHHREIEKWREKHSKVIE